MLTGSEYNRKQCGQNIPQHNRSSNTLVAAKLCRRSRAETCVYAAGEESRDRWNAAVPYANLLLSPSINVSGIILFFVCRKRERGKDDTAERTQGGRRKFTVLRTRHERPSLAASLLSRRLRRGGKQALKLPVFILECCSVFQHLAYSKQ